MRLFDLHDGIRAWLAAESDKQVGLSRVPVTEDELNSKPNLEMPYGILTPIPTGRGDGECWFNPEGDREWIYNLLSAGASPEQVLDMQGRFKEIILGLDPGGGYATAPAVAGCDVYVRSSDLLGGILPTGVNLFNTIDIYRFGVQETT